MISCQAGHYGHLRLACGTTSADDQAALPDALWQLEHAAGGIVLAEWQYIFLHLQQQPAQCDTQGRAVQWTHSFHMPKHFGRLYLAVVELQLAALIRHLAPAASTKPPLTV